MQELRFVAVSEDGSYAVLAVPGRSGRYILPIDERLRAVALGQTSRLAQYEIEVESPLRPKEIQARIRAGETAEEIADAAGIPVERVRWFEGPVLAERAYVADQAQAGSVRRAGDSAGPGPRLGEVVTARLSAAGTDPADGQWDSRKRGDGNWQVSLTFPSGGRLHVAEWVFDPRRRHVMPDDDNAARLSLPESDLPPEPVSVPGEATVTQIASRLGAAAGIGGLAAGTGVSRYRPDRSVIPDRSLGADRSLADRPAASPQGRPAVPERPAVPDRAAAAERPAMSHGPASSPVLPRPAQQDRPGYTDRHADPGYAEFPESAPYRAPEPRPTAYGTQAPAASATDAPAAVTPAAPASDGPAYGDPERDRLTPPPPVGFEDPGPAFGGEQPGLSPGAVPAPAAPSASWPSPAQEPGPAAGAGAGAAQAAGGAQPVTAAQAQPVAAPVREQPAPAETTASPEPAAPVEYVAASGPAAAPAAAASAAPATAGQETEVPAAVAGAVTEDQPARPRPAKKNAKARRSSVPSWDEIMLGSSRQRD